MKITTKQKAIVKSYVHGLILAVLPLAINGESNWKWYGVAVISAVVLPALRALDKNDPAFGIVADAVAVKTAEVEATLPAAKTSATKPTA